MLVLPNHAHTPNQHNHLHTSHASLPNHHRLSSVATNLTLFLLSLSIPIPLLPGLELKIPVPVRPLLPQPPAPPSVSLTVSTALLCGISYPSLLTGG